MSYRRIALASVFTLVLMTCAGCSVEQLDRDGDGFISEEEFVAAVFENLCDDGANESPDDETPDDETPDDETPDGETPDDGVTDGEIPIGEPTTTARPQR